MNQAENASQTPPLVSVPLHPIVGRDWYPNQVDACLADGTAKRDDQMHQYRPKPKADTSTAVYLGLGYRCGITGQQCTTQNCPKPHTANGQVSYGGGK